MTSLNSQLCSYRLAMAMITNYLPDYP